MISMNTLQVSIVSLPLFLLASTLPAAPPRTLPKHGPAVKVERQRAPKPDPVFCAFQASSTAPPELAPVVEACDAIRKIQFDKLLIDLDHYRREAEDFEQGKVDPRYAILARNAKRRAKANPRTRSSLERTDLQLPAPTFDQKKRIWMFPTKENQLAAVSQRRELADAAADSARKVGKNFDWNGGYLCPDTMKVPSAGVWALPVTIIQMESDTEALVRFDVDVNRDVGWAWLKSDKLRGMADKQTLRLDGLLLVRENKTYQSVGAGQRTVPVVELVPRAGLIVPKDAPKETPKDR